MSQITAAAPSRPATAAPPAESATSPAAIEDGRFAPHPTRRTVALRTFIPWQIVRFAVINLRMFRIIAKSHD